jgi:hypothetical protein
MNFRNLAIISAFLCFALAAAWMLAPEILLSLWGVEFSSATGLVSRRAAALFAGFCVMFICIRNAEPSPSRSGLVSGFVVACLLLAALGVFELATGHAGIGILSAVITEVVLALAFLSVGRVRSLT